MRATLPTSRYMEANFLLSHTDDILLTIASILGAKDLLSLELTHTRFSVKIFGPSASVGAGGAAAVAAAIAAPERWSLPQEAARRRVATHPRVERVPRRGREPWLAPLRDLEALAELRVTRVTVCTGLYVDSITFRLSDGSHHFYGGNGGSQQPPFDLDKDEHIVELRCREGDALDQVQFVTSSGRTSQQYGGHGGQAIVRTLPGSEPVAGLVCDHSGWTWSSAYLGPVPGMISVDDVFIRQHGEERRRIGRPHTSLILAVGEAALRRYEHHGTNSRNGFNVVSTSQLIYYKPNFLF